MKKNRHILIVIAITIVAVEILLYFYRASFLCQEKNSIFIYTWDFLHQHIAIPACEEWKWVGVFRPGGLARYIDAFFVQFYFLRYGVDVVLILLTLLQTFLSYKIFGKTSKRFLKIQRSRRANAEARERTDVRDRASSAAQRRDLKILGTSLLTIPLWFYIITNPAFAGQGIMSGYILSLIATLHIMQIPKSSDKIIAVIFSAPLQYFFTGIPATMLFCAIVIIEAIIKIITEKHFAKRCVNIVIIVLTASTTALPALVAEPLFLQSKQEAYNAKFFTQFKEKSSDKFYHKNRKVEYAIYKEQYDEALKLCNEVNPKNERPKSNQEYFSLLELAHYTKVSLLFSGKLLDDFFLYYDKIGMQWLFPANFSNKEFANLFYKLGETQYAYHCAIDEIEVNGYSVDMLKKLATHGADMDGLSNFYREKLSKTLFHKNHTQASAKRPLRTPAELPLPPDIIILQYMNDQGEQAEAIRQCKILIEYLFQHSQNEYGL